MSVERPAMPDWMPDRAVVEGRAAALAVRTLPSLMEEASAIRTARVGRRITFSPKVFIPLTRLCRDACGYCTFAHPPRRGEAAFMMRDQVLAIARAGAAAGCTEALFTLGDRPEARYRLAADELAALGMASTVDHLAAMADIVRAETGLLPHLNAGILDEAEFRRLRTVSASQGLMLESTALSLLAKGGPHHRTHTKHPAMRLASIAAAGAAAVPFTTGILIGIGETRRDRIEALLAIRAAHERYGHIQEVIVQNFLPKPDTRMARSEPAAFEELLWTTAAARLVLGPDISLQVPPNLSFERFAELIDAGIDDWGGVSPVTPDHVNPEAAWPSLDKLRRATESAGFALAARLPIYPNFLSDRARWLDPAVHTAVQRASDAEGLARADGWSPGLRDLPVRPPPAIVARPYAGLARLLDRAAGGNRLDLDEIAALFTVRGAGFDAVLQAADDLRARMSGETVRYVVNRNINYTNICSYHCSFCAFSKGRNAAHLRGPAYDLDLDEVSRRAAEAWSRGATEVCMQGGIHPRYTGKTYLDLLAAARRGAPGIHIHAFSPLEVSHGAETLGLSVPAFLDRLRAAGLGSLPGTAAEILDDEARSILCPDKLSAQAWLDVIRHAHRAGLPTTATIMFGHVDTPKHWATHLLALRDLQEETGGFTEFVPLPFVHMEAPIYLKGRARKGPTFREALLMHAVARLVLHPLITNIQASWVKLGPAGAHAALGAGANDLGGTLMNESISRAAGTEHGQELPPAEMEAVIRAAGRAPQQRTTLYRVPADRQILRSHQAAPLDPILAATPGPVARPAFA